MSSIVENIPTPRESLFELYPASQLPHTKKTQKLVFLLIVYKNRYFPIGTPDTPPWAAAMLFSHYFALFRTNLALLCTNFSTKL